MGKKIPTSKGDGVVWRRKSLSTIGTSVVLVGKKETIATMDLKLVDTKHTNLLGKAMDAYALRQKAISANIANIDTPGYNRQEVNFEDQLQKASRMNSSGSDQDKVRGKIEEGEGKPELEDEMFTLADTQIRVHLATRALRHSFSLLKASITGRNSV